MIRELDPSRLDDHVDRLFRAAWALSGSREDAEDLVQETYARVLARPRLLRNDDDLGYLMQALRNTHRSERRKASNRPPVALEEPAEQIDRREAQRPESALEAMELYAVISALPAELRDVLVAVDVGGLSYRETAKALKIPEGTVMSRLYRARSRTAQALAGP